MTSELTTPWQRIEKWKEENQITEQEEEAEASLARLSATSQALRLEQEQMDNFLRSASGDESEPGSCLGELLAIVTPGDPYEEEEEVEAR